MAFATVIVVLLLLSAGLFERSREKAPGRFQPLFCAAGDGDEDIKIAGDTFQPPRSFEDSAEAAAEEFLLQKKAGNIDKARELGIRYAEAIVDISQQPLAGSLRERTQRELHHQLLLCSYVINRVIADHSPNSILAQTALNVFYSEIERRSPILHQHVSDMAAFSLYILCERSAVRNADEIGEIYARLCGVEGHPQMIEEGNRIYRDFYADCEEQLRRTAYHSTK